MQLFLLVQENISRHRIAVNPKIKLEYKAILVFFSFRPSFSYSVDIQKRRQVNGVRRKKKSDMNLRISQQYQQFTNQPTNHNHETNPPYTPNILNWDF